MYWENKIAEEKRNLEKALEYAANHELAGNRTSAEVWLNMAERLEKRIAAYERQMTQSDYR